MCAALTHIPYLEGERIRELLLNAQIPLRDVGWLEILVIDAEARTNCTSCVGSVIAGHVDGSTRGRQSRTKTLIKGADTVLLQNPERQVKGQFFVAAPAFLE